MRRPVSESREFRFLNLCEKQFITMAMWVWVRALKLAVLPH